MRRLLLALVLACGAVPAFAFSGCLANDSGSGSAADAETYDANPPVYVEDGGGQDQTLPTTEDAGPSDAAPIETGPGDATVVDSGNLDSSVPDSGTDASDAAIPGFDAGTTANVRFANMVPDLGTAVDVCAAEQGQPLQGPFLKAAGVTAGLAYGQLTQYVTVPLVTSVHVRVVAADAADCSVPLLPDYDNLPITVAYQATVALIGSTSDAGAHAPELVAYPDDPPSGFPTQGSRVRIIHAAPMSPATDFEIGAGSTYVFPQQVAVPFGAATSAATMATGGYVPDSNGYFIQASGAVQITAVESSTDVASFATGAGSESAATTVFFAGIPGSSTTPLGTFACDDTATPSNFLYPCYVHVGPPILSTVRVVNLAAALPAVDLCIELWTGPTTQRGPILAGAGAPGVGYDQMSGDIWGASGPIPTDTDFNFTFVPAGQPCTATPLFVSPYTYVYGLYRGESTALISTALAILQSYPSTGGYSLGPWQMPTTPTAGKATLQLTVDSLRDYSSAYPPLYDVYETPPDGGTQVLFANLIDSAEPIATLAPGTYSLQVTAVDGGATLYSQSGITFNANDLWGLWFFDSSATTQTLARCNLGQPDAGAVTSCAE